MNNAQSFRRFWLAKKSLAAIANDSQMKGLLLNIDALVNERTYELSRMNKVLETFSSDVARDLRIPVNEMLGHINIIRHDHLHTFNADMKELFAHVESSARRMNVIIDDLLTLAKYKSAKMSPVTIEMTKLANKVWEDILLTTPHCANLQLMMLPDVEGDSSLIEQVLINLFSNAVKYSSKKTHPVVKVGYRMVFHKIIFYVQDNGAGFDMQHVDRLFAPFQRLHGMKDFEGTGVGLSLVKQIIKRHGGSIWADASVDEGAVFYFTLPGLNAKNDEEVAMAITHAIPALPVVQTVKRQSFPAAILSLQ